MRIVAALGGNALLERGEPPESRIQEAHMISAVRALAPLAAANELIITHGQRPQVGLVGPVYGEQQAKTLAAASGWTVRQDATRWRRVVPSPEPTTLLDLPAIRLLLDSGAIVISSGGGGIPVVRCDDGPLRGVEAVIDKDLAAALLARDLHADALLLLTGDAGTLITR